MAVRTETIETVICDRCNKPIPDAVPREEPLLTIEIAADSGWPGDWGDEPVVLRDLHDTCDRVTERAVATIKGDTDWLKALREAGKADVEADEGAA